MNTISDKALEAILERSRAQGRRMLAALYGIGVYAVLVICFLALNGCTIAKYSGPDHSLTVIDLHPTGNTVNLEGMLEGKGSMSLNREQGSAEGIVSEVTSAVTPNPLD